MVTIDAGELMVLTGFGFYPTSYGAGIMWALPTPDRTHVVAVISRYDGAYTFRYYSPRTSTRSAHVKEFTEPTLSALMEHFPVAGINYGEIASPIAGFPNVIDTLEDPPS